MDHTALPPMSRERDLTRAFVALSSSLANGYDVVDLLSELTADCAQLLDVASAGLLLADKRGVLHVLAASTERTRHLEVFALQREEGPCLDCYSSGRPVLVPDLEQETGRWPQFAQGARMAGFASVHALPMRLRDRTLGALGLFGTGVGGLNSDDLSLGQALADVASVAVVQEEATADKTRLAEHLQTALNSRVIIEQAKGVLAQQGASDMTQAFAVLRRYSRDHNQRLTDVAQAVVSGSLSAEHLIHHPGSRRQPARPSGGHPVGA
jgi:transcriptional regulator with GAF, ATPase, and Fis domain